MVKEGILKGTKGPRGGYTLAREKRKISVGEIFSLLSLDAPVKGGKINSIRKNITNKIDNEIANCIKNSLGKTTIEDLCKQLETKATTGGKVDFNI